MGARLIAHVRIGFRRMDLCGRSTHLPLSNRFSTHGLTLHHLVISARDIAFDVFRAFLSMAQEGVSADCFSIKCVALISPMRNALKTETEDATSGLIIVDNVINLPTWIMRLFGSSFEKNSFGFALLHGGMEILPIVSSYPCWPAAISRTVPTFSSIMPQTLELVALSPDAPSKHSLRNYRKKKRQY